MTILVVDANEITRRLVVGVLSTRGFTTCEAANAEEAAGMLRHAPRVMVVGEDVDRTHLRFPRMVVLEQPFAPDKLVARVEALLAPVKDGAKEAAPMKAEDFMRRAIDLSQEKMDANCGGPFGAVIVKDGAIIGEGWNAVTSTNDPTAHAEMMAIRNAATALGTFSLEGCEIYTSCEPCPMCLAAIYWARLDRVFYGNTREDAEKIGFDDDFIYRELAGAEDRRLIPARALLREEAQAVFDDWMKKSDRTEY